MVRELDVMWACTNMLRGRGNGGLRVFRISPEDGWVYGVLGKAGLLGGLKFFVDEKGELIASAFGDELGLGDWKRGGKTDNG